MADAQLLAGLLLVAGPVVGLIPVAHPALIPFWSATRERQLEIVGAHRRAWWALNAGFGVATAATIAGLAVLPLLAATTEGAAALLPALAAYALGGVLWCAVLAIRGMVTPRLASLAGAGEATEPGESLLGAAQEGLFDGFVVATGLALVALGIGLAATGIVAPPIAVVQALAGAGVLAWLLATGDVIPAVLYLPTMVLGVALLAAG